MNETALLPPGNKNYERAIDVIVTNTDGGHVGEVPSI